MLKQYALKENKLVCPNCGCEEMIDFYIEDGYICIECEEFFSYDDLEYDETTVDYVLIEYDEEKKIFEIIRD